MATAPIPVMTWEDYQGCFTVRPIELDLYEDLAGYDAQRSEAMSQVKDFLTWKYKRDQCDPECHFLEPELFHIKVTVRPRYDDSIDRRSYTGLHKVDLSIPCVRGQRESGRQRCSIPTLGISFDESPDIPLRQYAAELVRHRLEGSSMGELARLLPPQKVALDHVHVKYSPKKPPRTRPPIATPTLQSVAEAMGSATFRKQFSAPYQRDEELVALGQLLDSKAHLILVGDASVGKTTLLSAAVRAHERRGEHRRNSLRFWRTSAARLIAGMQYLGEWQERCEALISELSAIEGVLCIDRLMDLIRLGGEGPLASIAAFFLPYLQNGELRLIGEASAAELEACRRLFPTFVAPFRLVRVESLKDGTARDALTQLARTRSINDHVAMEQPAIDSVLRLFRRFMPYRPLPGRAAAFAGELFDEAKQHGESEIATIHVLNRFIQETGLPELFLDDEQILKLETVTDAFRKKIIGQDRACQAAARLVSTFKAGLNDPRQPIGSLLFCGPTGVGKTQLAKVLSQYLFGQGADTDRLVRLDMSEYSGPLSAERLITKADGKPSDFVERVRKQPFVVVLLDEIEKAHPEVFDVLLGMLDEGRLTDRYGRTTYFVTTIIIMTSNLGASASRAIGFVGETPGAYEAEVRSFFRPEFFNRLDGIVTFSSLSNEACIAITRKELTELAEREGIAKRKLRLTFTDRLVDRLVQYGFDPGLGARPLQRAMEQLVVSELSRYLVEHPGLFDMGVLLDVDELGRCTIDGTMRS